MKCQTMKKVLVLLPLAAAFFSQGLFAEEKKVVESKPKLAYGLMIQQGERVVFSPCRDRSYTIVEDISEDRFVTKNLNSVGLNAGKKIYVELVAVLEGGVLKASGINVVQTDGRCQLPGTSEETWQASGNEPGWVLLAGGEQVSLKQSGKPDVSAPYSPFKHDGKLATFEAGKLNVRFENTPCSDPLAKAVFGWTATVTVNGQVLKGCAKAR
jgi:putative lipoprotein